MVFRVSASEPQSRISCLSQSQQPRQRRRQRSSDGSGSRRQQDMPTPAEVKAATEVAPIPAPDESTHLPADTIVAMGVMDGCVEAGNLQYYSQQRDSLSSSGVSTRVPRMWPTGNRLDVPHARLNHQPSPITLTEEIRPTASPTSFLM